MTIGDQNLRRAGLRLAFVIGTAVLAALGVHRLLRWSADGCRSQHLAAGAAGAPSNPMVYPCFPPRWEPAHDRGTPPR